MNVCGYVYCLTNTVNGKKYIGLTTRTVSARIKEHENAESYIGNAIRKHGRDNFTLQVLDKANDLGELKEKEIYWINEYDTYNSGYNQTIGGDGNCTNYTIPVELNGKQENFIKYLSRENSKVIEVDNPISMVKSLLINFMGMYLQADRITDKKLSAQTIMKLKPEYQNMIKNTKVIDFTELSQYE